MTDSRLSFTARAIILLLGLSLLVMLGVTVKERISNPHLVTERPAAPQGMGQEQSLLASLMQKVAAEPTNKDALMHLAEHLPGMGRRGHLCPACRGSGRQRSPAPLHAGCHPA